MSFGVQRIEKEIDGFKVSFPLATGSVAVRAAFRLSRMIGPVLAAIVSKRNNRDAQELSEAQLSEALKLAAQSFDDADIDYFETAYLSGCTVSGVAYKIACGEGGILTGKPFVIAKILFAAVAENNRDFFRGLSGLNLGKPLTAALA